eukprot:gene10254-10412_t
MVAGFRQLGHRPEPYWLKDYMAASSRARQQQQQQLGGARPLRVGAELAVQALLAAAPHMSAAHLDHIKALRAQGIARLGRDPKLQHPKRVLQDVAVGPGAYVRVHVHPKRFPAAYSVDWQLRIIADNPEFVVVDKPPGVQVPSTVDNVLESVVSCTAAALGLPGYALLNTHRLDAGTSGVVVLAKSSSCAAWFNSLLRHKPDNIVKVYRCLSRQRPPLGLLVHYAKVHSRGKGEPAHTRMTRPQPQTQQATSSSSSDTVFDGRDPGRSLGPNEEGLVEAAGGAEGARCELVVLQAHQLQVRDEEGRMKQQVKWWRAEQQLLQQQQLPQAWRGALPPRPGGDEEWIEFQAGVPWWRQKD